MAKGVMAKGVMLCNCAKGVMLYNCAKGIMLCQSPCECASSPAHVDYEPPGRRSVYTELWRSVYTELWRSVRRPSRREEEGAFKASAVD